MNVAALIMGVLIGFWALRLSTHILLRSLKARAEDFRYTQLRNKWSRHHKFKAYLWVFNLQALLSLIIGSPLYLIHFYPQPAAIGTALTLLTTLGIFIAWLGLLWEATADYQKTKFKERPGNRDRICFEGLWKTARHPNYFGEVLFWWGLFFMSAPQLPLPFTILSPVLINYLLLKVSGVPMLAERYKKLPDYPQYLRIKNNFIPSKIL